MLRVSLLSSLLVIFVLAPGCAQESATTQATAAADDAFMPLFNGKDLSGWSYAKDPQGREMKAGLGYQVRPADGVVYTTAKDGGRLSTDKEYADFDLQFDFKLSQNANNGIGIRAPAEGNPAYRGMEIQILDDTGPQYHKPNREIRPAQYHGSIYDVVPAEQGHLKPVGEWNSEEIIARGPHIKVILNGATIVDANLNEVTDEHVLAKHPGLRAKTGHIELLGHGSAVEFRNMRVKSL